MPSPQPSVKQEVERVLAKLPDDASLEDGEYHLYVLHHIERGHRDIEERRVLSSEEVERRMARWLDR